MSRRAPAMLLVGIVGLGLIGWVGLAALSAPFHLDASSPTVMSSSAECDARSGARYEIRVDGKSYGGCTGATNKCAGIEAVEIAFDPSDPSQCRVATAVDGLGRYEATLMLLGLGLSFAGVAGASSVLAAQIRRGAAVDDDTENAAKRLRLLQRITWAALAAAVVTANGTALYALL